MAKPSASSVGVVAAASWVRLSKTRRIRASSSPGRRAYVLDVGSDEMIDWLLAGDASIRWQTRRDLLDQTPDVYEADRADVARTGWARELLDRQDPEGSWAGGLYSPKWTSTTYTLLLLRLCGVAPGDPRALRGVALLWEGAFYFDGGLTAAATIAQPEACITSMYVALAKYFGFDDPRVEAAIGWLLANELDDGGWNCRTVRFGDRHGSFHTSISALEALAEVHRLDRAAPKSSKRCRRVASSFWITVSSSPTGKARSRVQSSQAFRFPRSGTTTSFVGLSTSRPRTLRATSDISTPSKSLRGYRRKDGTWPLHRKHAGKVWFDMERTGSPSRWNTLRALRVLRWAERHLDLT